MKDTNVLIGRITLTMCVCVAASVCLGQEGIEGADSIHNVANENGREEMRRRELAAVEAYLNSQGIPMSKGGIKKHLQQVNTLTPDISRAEKWIRQLGSDRFVERKAAQQSLMKLPVIPIDLLQEATKDSDLEVASRARRILRDAISQQSKSVKHALRAIELLQLSELTNEIFAAIRKFRDDETIVRAANKTMLAVVTVDDIPFLSSQMNMETTATLRNISICALRQLEDAAMADRFEVWSRNEQFHEVTRLESALALADLGDRRSLNSLLGLMVEAKSSSIRARSAHAMRTLTGQRFAFYAYAKSQSRLQEAQAWKEWISVNGETAPLKFPMRGIRATGSRLNGQTLVTLCGVGPNKVILYDQAMRESWSYRSPYPVSAWPMENGNYLISQLYGPDVIEVTSEGSIVRTRTMTKNGAVSDAANYDVNNRVNNAQPLPSGNFLVSYERGFKPGQDARVIEIDPQGKVVWELKPRWNSIGNVVRLENGNTLVVENRPDGIKLVVVYNPAGKIAWEWGSEKTIDSIQALGNGNVLVCLRKSGIIELNLKTNEIVWELLIEGVRHAYQIENGNLLIITNSRFAEVEPDGTEAWSKKIRTTSGSIRR